MKNAAHWDFGRGCCTKHLGQPAPCPVCIEAGDFVDDDAINSKERENAYVALLGGEHATKVGYDEVAARLYIPSSFGGLVEQGRVAGNQDAASQGQDPITESSLQVAKAHGALDPVIWCEDGGSSAEQSKRRADTERFLAQRAAAAEQATALWKQFLEAYHRSPSLIGLIQDSLVVCVEFIDPTAPLPEWTPERLPPKVDRTLIKNIMFGSDLRKMLPRGEILIETERPFHKLKEIKNPCGEIALGPPEVAYHAPDGRTPEQHEVLMQQMLTDKQNRIVEMAKEMKFFFPEALCGKSGDAGSLEPCSEPCSEEPPQSS